MHNKLKREAQDDAFHEHAHKTTSLKPFDEQWDRIVCVQLRFIQMLFFSRSQKKTVSIFFLFARWLNKRQILTIAQGL